MRCKIVLIMIIGISFTSLLALTDDMSMKEDYFRLSLIRSEIRNETYLFNLQDEPDPDRAVARQDFQESYFDFALLGYRTFRSHLSHFFTDRQRSRSFLDYSVVDGSISGRLQVSMMAGADYHTDFEESYLHLYRGVQLRGNIYNRLVFWGNWWAGRFQGDLDYAEANSPLIKGFYKSHLDHPPYTNLNKISGSISYLFDFGKITIGRGTHLIGDNIGGSIILNDAVNDYGYFSGEIKMGKIALSFLHASLIPDNLGTAGDFYYEDKFLVLHQIDYRPLPQIEFFFGEKIVYANRSLDPSYLLPHTFYRITEHNLRDRDNVLIYAGMRLTYRNLVTFYGNLNLDELRKSEIFGDWWGNKYALQAGMSWTYAEELFARGNEPVRTTLEFTAVRPWMYTHHSMFTTLSHDGRGLAFPEGSNLIQTAGEIRLPLFYSISLNQFLSFTRQGSVGNNFAINYNDRPSDTAKWLEGDVTERWLSRSVLSWSMLAHHKLRIGLEMSRGNSEDWQKNLVFGYQALY